MERVKIMNTIRNIFQAIKATLKFLWRHCLTLSVFIVAIDAYMHNNPVFIRVFVTILIAAFLDWVKMKIKVTPNSDKLGEITPTLQSRSPQNYHMVGTASYLSNIGHR